MLKIEKYLPQIAVAQVIFGAVADGLLLPNNGYQGFLAIIPIFAEAILFITALIWLGAAYIHSIHGPKPHQKAVICSGIILLSPIIFYAIWNQLSIY